LGVEGWWRGWWARSNVVDYEDLLEFVEFSECFEIIDETNSLKDNFNALSISIGTIFS
jgi:hypothetical protein